MEQDHDYSPSTIWSQPPLTTTRRRKPPIDPVVLIILLPILALVFLFCFLPPFLHHASHILKPGSVKSTWDSLNIFLVLFAIICGVMARKNDDIISSSDSTTATDDQAGNNISFVATTNSTSDSINLLDSSGQWAGFSDRKGRLLRRNSSLYPDLRQESVWENHEYPNQYFDDFNLNPSPVSRYHNSLPRWIQKQNEIIMNITPVPSDPWQSRRSEADLVDVKEIVVDTFENVPRVMPPPPPPPPNSKRQSFRSVGRDIKSDELKKVRSPPPATDVRLHRSRHKHNKLERKVSDATKEIATAISSLVYNNQRKRKNKKRLQQNVPEIPGSSETSPASSVHSPENEQPPQTLAPPPPPPPPPLPSTMFQNLFKKGGKHHKRRIHSIMPAAERAPPPPPPLPPNNSIFNNIFKSSGNKSKRFQSPHTTTTPPPPPLPSIMNNIFKTGTKSKRFDSITGKSTPPPLPPPIKKEPRSSISKGKPPLPAPRTSSSSYYERDEFLASDSQSPLLIPMPPPPPPPFKMPAMKFELHGDFVKVQSSHSSVCSSPDRGDFEQVSSSSMNNIIIDAGRDQDAAGRVFFPSPDVNAKADSFISRLKDEWRMEQIH